MAALKADGFDLEGFWTIEEFEQLLGHGVHVGHDDDNAVLARFTSDGTHIRSMEIEGAGSEYLNDIAVDPNGNALVVGWFNKEVTIGGEKLSIDTGNAMFVTRMEF